MAAVSAIAYNMAKNIHKAATAAPPVNTITPKSTSGSAMRIKLCLLLAVVAFIVYGNTLKNEFAVDDTVMLTNNEYVQMGLQGIPKLLVTPHQAGHWRNDNDEYRPLSLVLFAAEYQLWELSPTGYHFMNILLFAGCVVLLFLFLYELFDRKKIVVAFIAALLFAVHPIHTEVVANIKSSDELLSFLLAFTGLLVCTKYVRTGSVLQLMAAILCFFLAHLAKESVVTFIAVVPVVFYFFINSNKKRSLHVSLGFVVAAALFVIARYAVLSYWHVNNVAQITLIENALRAPGLSAASRIATAVLMMGMYLKLLFIPYPLISDYSFSTIPFTHFSDPLVLLSFALYTTLAVVCITRFRKDRRDPYAFAIFFFFVTIALFTNIFIPIKATMGERFLFYPSVGLCIAAAALIARWAGDAGMNILKQAKILAVLVPVCVLWGGMAIARNPDWKDNNTIYGTDVIKAPGNAHLNYFYGYDQFSRYHKEQNPAERQRLLSSAIEYFRNALAIYPGYNFVLADLGAAYFCNKQYDSAEHYDKKMVKADPKYDLARNNLSGVYLNTKKYREDIDLCKETITVLPHNVNSYADMGLSYKALGIYDSAIYYLRMGMAIEPKFIGFYQVMSNVYYTMGKTDSADIYAALSKRMEQ
ncbi:MAG: hypothetical protein JWQ38_3269 [Flavipsychrobacter sp.]|nr:hypothetical protein [Flavipsychrobacter sp.]